MMKKILVRFWERPDLVDYFSVDSLLFLPENQQFKFEKYRIFGHFQKMFLV